MLWLMASVMQQSIGREFNGLYTSSLSDQQQRYWLGFSCTRKGFFDGILIFNNNKKPVDELARAPLISFKPPPPTFRNGTATVPIIRNSFTWGLGVGATQILLLSEFLAERADFFNTIFYTTMYVSVQGFKRIFDRFRAFVMKKCRISVGVRQLLPECAHDVLHVCLNSPYPVPSFRIRRLWILWRHGDVRVIWRHRWRHRLTRRMQFPVGSLLDTNRLVYEIII